MVDHQHDAVGTGDGQLLPGQPQVADLGMMHGVSWESLGSAAEKAPNRGIPDFVVR
jgi:hypothetical protein